MHLADAFIQSDLVHSGYTFFVSILTFESLKVTSVPLLFIETRKLINDKLI